MYDVPTPGTMEQWKEEKKLSTSVNEIKSLQLSNILSNTLKNITSRISVGFFFFLKKLTCTLYFIKMTTVRDKFKIFLN